MKLHPIVVVSLGAFALTGCVNHINPYKPKKRDYQLPVTHPAYDAARASGSLFDPTSVGSRLMTDARAQQVNDLVVIAINETATAQRDTATEIKRDDETTAQLTAFLGLIKEIQDNNPNFDGTQAVNTAFEHQFTGEGSTERNERLEATVPAMVRQVLPNGNLFVEGHRVVLVNHEEHHFYISGVIRPDDIDGNGVVQSSRMADAQIEFVGRGDLTSGTSKGWFSRAMDTIWPF